MDSGQWTERAEHAGAQGAQWTVDSGQWTGRAERAGAQGAQLEVDRARRARS